MGAHSDLTGVNCCQLLKSENVHSYHDFEAFLWHFVFSTIINNFSTFFRRYVQPQKYFKKSRKLNHLRTCFRFFLRKKGFLSKIVLFDDFEISITGISHVVKTKSDMDVLNSQSIRGTTNIGTHAENIFLLQSFENVDGTVSTVLDINKCRFGQKGIFEIIKHPTDPNSRYFNLESYQKVPIKKPEKEITRKKTEEKRMMSKAS